MIELVLLVCLIGHADDCHEEKQGAVDGPPQACMVAGPAAAADYDETHPKYKVARIICRPPGRAI